MHMPAHHLALTIAARLQLAPPSRWHHTTLVLAHSPLMHGFWTDPRAHTPQVPTSTIACVCQHTTSRSPSPCAFVWCRPCAQHRRACSIGTTPLLHHLMLTIATRHRPCAHHCRARSVWHHPCAHHRRARSIGTTPPLCWLTHVLTPRRSPLAQPCAYATTLRTFHHPVHAPYAQPQPPAAYTCAPRAYAHVFCAAPRTHIPLARPCMLKHNPVYSCKYIYSII
jgi:hypothetical protein